MTPCHNIAPRSGLWKRRIAPCELGVNLLNSFSSSRSVAALAKKNELSYGQMIASPTLARYFNTFSRDLTQISDTGGHCSCRSIFL
jgi:hypothetical protein